MERLSRNSFKKKVAGQRSYYLDSLGHRRLVSIVFGAATALGNPSIADVRRSLGSMGEAKQWQT